MLQSDVRPRIEHRLSIIERIGLAKHDDVRSPGRQGQGDGSYLRGTPDSASIATTRRLDVILERSD